MSNIGNLHLRNEVELLELRRDKLRLLVEIGSLEAVMPQTHVAIRDYPESITVNDYKRLIEHIHTLERALRDFLVPAGASPQELNDEGWSAMHGHSDIRHLWS